MYAHPRHNLSHPAQQHLIHIYIHTYMCRTQSSLPAQGTPDPEDLGMSASADGGRAAMRGSGGGRWFSLRKVVEGGGEGSKGGGGENGNGKGGGKMWAGLGRVLGGGGGGGGSKREREEGGAEEDEMARAIALSLQEGVGSGGGSRGHAEEGDEDEEMRQAIALSLQESGGGGGAK